MRRNKSRMLVTLFLVLALCASAISASAAVYSSDYLSVYTAEAEASSGRRITITVSIAATRPITKLGASEIKIMESSNGGSTWRTVKTYTPDDVSAMMSSGARYANSPVTYTGIAGYQYKAKVTCYAENSSGSYSAVFTTEPVTAIR